jgi:RNA polymerase sigma-70 factor (ECF subfamily)
MTADSDDRLRCAFARLGVGDARALDDVWRDWAGPLHGYAFALTGSQEEADDVIGDVLAALLRQGRRLARVREPRAYLFAAVRNAALTILRRHWRWRGGRDGQYRTGTGPENADEAEDLAIRQAVLSLPAEQREVVVLHVWGGLTFEEAARVARVPPNTAASRYRYALEKLRKVMTDEPVGR